jgi:hypothetical protein
LELLSDCAILSRQSEEGFRDWLNASIAVAVVGA